MDSFNNIPVSIRLNPFKEYDCTSLPLDGDVPWSPFGKYLSQRPSFTLDPLFHAGAYYVQDASAMFVGYMFRQALHSYPARRVLDLCAAPGGKSTDILTSLRLASDGDFVLFSNEVIRHRAAVLSDNLAIWGDPNVIVTSSDAKAFGTMGPFFDFIVADVPCSGEGMFRKSENARQMWSEDNVALCAARSRRIVADVWPSLAPGCLMLYSTCTLNDVENDGNLQWICESLGAEPVKVEMPFDGPQATNFGFVLEPGKVRGEGQYCALVRKTGNGGCTDSAVGVRTTENMPVVMRERKGEVYALPSVVDSSAELIGKRLNVLSAGVHAFTLKGRDRIPCADLALSLLLDGNDFPFVELDRQQALHYLHRDTLSLCDAPTGFVIVRYQGLPLGFVKNLGTRANNLHPQNRRILMDIE